MSKLILLERRAMSTKEKWLKQTGAYPESNARDARILAKVKTNSGGVEEKAIMVHPSLRGAAGARTAGGQPPKPFVRIDPNEEIDNDILRQYEFNQLLGRGAYGVVWKVRSKATRKHQAFKKLYHCWRNQTDAQRTYREIIYLHAFGKHDNSVVLRKVLPDKSNSHLYCVFDYMQTDLFLLARAQVLEENHKQYVAYQIMKFLSTFTAQRLFIEI